MKKFIKILLLIIIIILSSYSMFSMTHYDDNGAVHGIKNNFFATGLKDYKYFYTLKDKEMLLEAFGGFDIFQYECISFDNYILLTVSDSYPYLNQAFCEFKISGSYLSEKENELLDFFNKYRNNGRIYTYLNTIPIGKKTAIVIIGNITFPHFTPAGDINNLENMPFDKKISTLDFNVYQHDLLERNIKRMSIVVIAIIIEVIIIYTDRKRSSSRNT